MTAARDRGPRLPVIEVSEEQEQAIREAFPSYAFAVRPMLLALAGRWDLIDPPIRAMVRHHLRTCLDSAPRE